MADTTSWPEEEINGKGTSDPTAVQIDLDPRVISIHSDICFIKILIFAGYLHWDIYIVIQGPSSADGNRGRETKRFTEEEEKMLEVVS